MQYLKILLHNSMFKGLNLSLKSLFTVFLIFVSTQLFADMVWQKNISSAFEVAKKENRTVMLFVESQYCRWCKKMKHRTLSNSSVEKRLEPYVLVEVMREDADEMKSLPSIHGVPTIFFMTANKKVLETVIGYFNVEDFLSYIDDVEKKVLLNKES